MSDDQIDPTSAVEYMLRTASRHAKAKAERVYLEQFRKSKKAILMNDCQEKTAAAKEQYAYSHPDYLQLLDGLRVAVESEETLRWKMVAAQAKVEIWRTQSANNRGVDRAAA
ncbi:hypothetical protein [Curvibacter lanceolatus]|uniref:hypothetical protein n=1 Tax=Curvibacter lanceolatus TaxID=86182 RepID=UPI0003A745B5|nr:hypothetical protein [Curvibacter lanceolatus]